MVKKTLVIFLWLLFSFKSSSQNMTDGFNKLEAGNYKEAVVFFKNILNKHPNNKTAQICYGRAVGLQGDTKKAIQIFLDLLKSYSNDFEIKLNYAEALLWNKDFNSAKTQYNQLLEKNSSSFSALLGYANTLSNLKDYSNALTYINKALVIKAGNTNALNSKKYIYLGKAYLEQKNENYKTAEQTLKDGLIDFKNDTDLLKNLVNLYVITNKTNLAEAVYTKMLERKTQKIDALNGLALLEHLKGHQKKAYKLAADARASLSKKTNKNLKKQTSTRYIQALIWNKKYHKAKSIIDSLITIHPKANWVLALRATYNTYTNNFKKSITDYNTILKNNTASFDGNLGKANALKALGYYKPAYQAANKTLTHFKNQKDVLEFISTLDKKFTPTIETKSYYAFDNGNNKAYALHAQINIPTSTKLSWLAQYGFRTTQNKVINNKAKSNDIKLGLTYQIKNNINFKSLIGITDVNTSTNNYTQFTNHTTVQIIPFKKSILDIGFKSEVQDFNASLLNRQIVMNNIYANHNLNTNFNLGWYTQYYYTWQSDSNTRQLFFTSLYYTLLNTPILKTGINYQYITFKNEVPSLYFSPKNFNAGEIFINLIKNENITKTKSWFYEFTAAIGLQNINNTTQQNTYRLQGKLGYKFNSRAQLNAYGVKSNIASTTAAGFTYNEIGLRFKWLITKSKVFTLKNTTNTSKL